MIFKAVVGACGYGGNKDWQYCPPKNGQPAEIWVPARLCQGRLPDFIWKGMRAADRAQFEWSREDVYNLLHETGHAHYGHVADPNPVIRLVQEKQAWQYAADCLSEAEHPALWQHAAYCMSTYERKKK